MSAVIELSERLIVWQERHPSWRPNPEWPEEVSCVLYEAPDSLALIDPLIRDDIDPQSWCWLDDRVASAERPVSVLLTAPWHERSARRVVERYGAALWVDDRSDRYANVPRLTALPTGIETFTPRGVSEGQVSFVISAEQTLVVAEFFLGTPNGLRVLPSPATLDMDEFFASLRELESMQIDRIVVAHGQSVFAGGGPEISTALRAFEVTRDATV